MQKRHQSLLESQFTGTVGRPLFGEGGGVFSSSRGQAFTLWGISRSGLVPWGCLSSQLSCQLARVYPHAAATPSSERTHEGQHRAQPSDWSEDNAKEVPLHWSSDCGSKGPGKVGFSMKSMLAERKGRNANSWCRLEGDPVLQRVPAV